MAHKLENFGLAVEIVEGEIMAYNLVDGEVKYEEVGVLQEVNKELFETLKKTFDVDNKELAKMGVSVSDESIDYTDELNDIKDSIETANALSSTVVKKVEIDIKTMKKLQIMMALHQDELSSKSKIAEAQNEIINMAINKLFEGDFLEKLKTL